MTRRTTVLKFGGSVLQSDADLPAAVNEIYRHWRQGSRVLAVVSAFGGRTDELLRRANSFGPDRDDAATASLLLTGEAESSSMLGLELGKVGIPAKVLTAHQISLQTRGDRLDAEPIWADTARLENELNDGIVIVSGFGGVDSYGCPTLLGRGGSDFTALFLAERLDARCILLKDVPGLYECDPAESHRLPRRFDRASYATAIQAGGPLIQEKSVRFAEQHSIEIELGQIGESVRTVVGSFQDSFAIESVDARPLRVALLGCGTVGGGVFERLSLQPETFEMIGVANRDRQKAIAASIPHELICRADDLLQKDFDVLLELIGGSIDAYRYIRHSLESGKHVVTANKALMAEHGTELEDLAKLNGVSLRFSAAVGGVVPALEAARLRNGFGSPVAITGILNGTCNFICDRVETGVSLDDAVLLAQEAGYAEADPTVDLDGTDAAQKLALLAHAAFGYELPVRDIERKGIQELCRQDLERAAANGKTIRLIAECRVENGHISASVAPREVPFEDTFAGVRGAENILTIRTDTGYEYTVRGRGAGRYATAESVIADLFDIRRTLSASHKHTAVKVLAAEVGK